ncbi:MAG TPA: MFS transporter [Gemmatimonadales bacterium]
MSATRPHDPYAALRHGDFRWYVLSVMAMTVATQIRGVVVAWQLYALTHDPLVLGLIGLAEALPFIATALFAGHVADTRDRRWIALLSMTALLGCAGALLALTYHPALGVAEVPWFYAVIAVSGVARSFLMTARTALVSEIVPRDHYANASAWRTSSWQFAAVLGPAIGGFLYAFGGARVSYATDVTLMALAVVTMTLVRPRGRPTGLEGEGIFASLGAGIRFVFSRQILLGAISLDLFAVLFGGAVALLPIFAADILHVGPQGLGVLRAAPAVGAVAMSLWIAHRPPMQRAGRALLIAVALFGLHIIAFGLSTSFWLSVGLLIFGGAVDTVSVVIRSTILQEWTPPELMGRVAAVNSVFIGSSNEIGAFESGTAAKLLGTVPSVIFGGLMTLGVVGVTAWRVPVLRELKELRAS